MAKIKKIGFYSDNGTVKVSKKYNHRTLHQINNFIDAYYFEEAEENPVNWCIETWWIFKGNIYEVDSLFTKEQARFLIISEFDKERKLFEKLKQRYESSKEIYKKRIPIPEHARIEVWRRDGGKCVKCGSREKLEYDHIIPLSKGGSNTTRNIELLCESCNRSKGANIE